MNPLPPLRARFLRIWVLGLLGVSGIALQPLPAELLAAAPELAALPPLAQRAVLIVNPLVLLTLMALAGALVAHRVGFGSRAAGTLASRSSDPAARWIVLSLGIGLGLAALLTALDVALSPLLGAQWKVLQAQANAAPVLPALLTGVLYGGIAEEILLRWGLMSVLAYGLWRTVRLFRGGAAPAPTAPVAALAPSLAWTAIALSALAFAAGHLPALAQSIELDGALVGRTMALNAIAGLGYGWLFWRHGLESAMLAHAATHVGFAAARLVVG